MPHSLNGSNGSPTKSRALADWVAECATLTQPDHVVWCDGSEDERQRLTSQAVQRGVLIPLNQKKRPNCYLHRSNPNDVARTEQLTFICTPTKEAAGPTNNWSDPAATYAKMRRWFTGSMRGRTMYVIPYIMGPLGSPFSKVGVEITDSIYVALNMRIMTRMGARRPRTARRVRRFQPRTALHARPQSRAPIDLSLSPGQHDLVDRQRLRRQRAAQQKMFRVADCELGRQDRGMAGRAHAHPRCAGSQGRDHLCRRRLPERLRQDQPRDAAAAGRDGEGGLESFHPRR